MATPIALLDVDGVIGPSSGQPLYDGEPVWADLLPGRMHFSRDVLDAITGWHDSGALDMRWLTTWLDEAVTDLTPALSLPVWPYYERRSAPAEFPYYPGVDWWKERIVRVHLDHGFRVAWLDDDIAFRCDVDSLTRRYGDRLLMISPDAGYGLTAADLALVDTWLAH